MYKLERSRNQYNKILRENLTKTYKKADESTLWNINGDLHPKTITSKIGVSDRMETMPKKQAFITLKEHKNNFVNNPTCRLINPTKSNMGIISKQILEDINNKVRVYCNVQQWKNSQSVINWFTSLKDKHSLTFLTFDIVDIIPSITEKLLTDSLNFASEFVNITDQDREIIMHGAHFCSVMKLKALGQRKQRVVI